MRLHQRKTISDSQYHQCMVGCKIFRAVANIFFEWMIINTWIVCIRVIFNQNQKTKKKNPISILCEQNFYSPVSLHLGVVVFFSIRIKRFCPIQDNCYDTFIRFFSHFFCFFARALFCVCVSECFFYCKFFLSLHLYIVFWLPQNNKQNWYRFKNQEIIMKWN